MQRPSSSDTVQKSGTKRPISDAGCHFPPILRNVYIFNAEGYKCESAEFENTYYVEPVEDEGTDETTPQTGDDNALYLGLALGVAGIVLLAWALVRRGDDKHDLE